MDGDALKRTLARVSTVRARGSVSAVRGLSMRVLLPGARIGDVLRIERRGEPLMAEIVGFEGGEVVALPLGEMTGVGPDDAVESTGECLRVPVGDALLGRVVDGLGRLLDGGKAAGELSRVPVERAAPPALSRRPVCEPLETGVSVIDTLLTLGRGQRVGLFSGSGVGKSTLLGAIARGTAADVIVVALVGERGREVSEFIEGCLGDALSRSVVVVATSDAPAMERVRAAQSATAIAEYFRDAGKNVLLLVDSVTRFARALREVGLAAGEPPARRGYPPSVFAALPRLLERGGQGSAGSITGIYTVLVEGGDMDEPIADEVRGILDGHIVLSREVAERGWFPAVDVGASLSRVMAQCVARDHVEAAKMLRQLLGAYESKRDLIALGAYQRGGDAIVDAAVELLPKIQRLLQQDPKEPRAFQESVAALKALIGELAPLG